jgi:hypothetical protein
MKTQFTITETCILPNGKVAVSGVAAARRLSSGERGRTSTKLGELEVEIVSVGLVDPPPADPNAQMLQLKVLEGDPIWLKGAILDFA